MVATASHTGGSQARSNQTCAETFSSVGADASELDTSTAFAGESTAAMVIAAMQTLVVNLIASSPPSDLDPPILKLSDTRIGGDRQLRFAFGQHLEPVRRNAANDEASEHRRGAALG